MSVVQRIFDLFETWGSLSYEGGRVTHKEHALQAAALAEHEGAPTKLVLAALLHDIGHLLAIARGDVQNDSVVDVQHQHIAGEWLAGSFGPDITEPVRLHVEAKRYLCAVDPDYVAQDPSVSLRRVLLKNGILKRSEIREFQENPYHRQAVWLCRIDDRARVAGLTVADLDHYRERLEYVASARYLELKAAWDATITTSSRLYG